MSGGILFKPQTEASENARPLITFALFAYNQERFIRDAVEGAFSQTYTPLEIILSDDCSTDRTFEIMKKMAAEYKGTHDIILNRNEVNEGLCSHFNRITEQAGGEIIIVAAGDDISLPERTEKSWNVLSDYPDATFVAFNYKVINSEGKHLPSQKQTNTMPFLTKVTLYDYLFKPTHLSGATRAFRKTIMVTFGLLFSKCPTEDSTMTLRGLMIGNAYLCDDVGIYYRLHGSNISGPNKIHTMDYNQIFDQYMKDIQTAEQKGIISDELSRRMKRWAMHNHDRRLLGAEFNRSVYKKLKYFFANIMCSKTYKFREKFRIFFNVMRGII